MERTADPRPFLPGRRSLGQIPREVFDASKSRDGRRTGLADAQTKKMEKFAANTVLKLPIHGQHCRMFIQVISSFPP
jgi:hypothetical protein